MKIAFVWFGMDGRYGQWKDGLWKAMQILEQDNEVKYFDPAKPDFTEKVKEFSPNIILFWEAMCTSVSKDKAMWDSVVTLPFKKILLFAGGPIKLEWAVQFDHICVESQINAQELEDLGITYTTAFGINDEIMKPLNLEKKYDGIHHGTCASWKRHWLVGESIGDKGVVAGRYQEHDRRGFDECKRLGTLVLPEQTPENIAVLLNESHCCLQTSDYWGGGQRCTLEAMSCGIPVIVMRDSPKNCEYVIESGAGLIVDPEPNQIRQAVEEIKKWTTEEKEKGVKYIQSKWTAKHYAMSLLQAIKKVI